MSIPTTEFPFPQATTPWTGFEAVKVPALRRGLRRGACELVVGRDTLIHAKAEAKVTRSFALRAVAGWLLGGPVAVAALAPRRPRSVTGPAADPAVLAMADPTNLVLPTQHITAATLRVGALSSQLAVTMWDGTVIPFRWSNGVWNQQLIVRALRSALGARLTVQGRSRRAVVAIWALLLVLQGGVDVAAVASASHTHLNKAAVGSCVTLVPSGDTAAIHPVSCATPGTQRVVAITTTPDACPTAADHYIQVRSVTPKVLCTQVVAPGN